jgi:hypothetical protein
MADEQNDEQNEAQELGQQLQTAAEAFRETAVRLLRIGEIHPQVIVMAAARQPARWARASPWRAGTTSKGCWASWPRSCGTLGGSTARRSRWWRRPQEVREERRERDRGTVANWSVLHCDLFGRQDCPGADWA